MAAVSNVKTKLGYINRATEHTLEESIMATYKIHMAHELTFDAQVWMSQYWKYTEEPRNE